MPGGQLHIGTWLMTLQIALLPQIPGHGSRHLLREQANSREQSLLRTHSGRQPMYGSPKYSGKQEQTPFSQRAFAPHGDKAHGSSSTGDTIFTRKREWINCLGAGISWHLQSGGFRLQRSNGLPVKSSGHVQTGVWLMTEHRAWKPQEPGQGSIQRCWLHALLLGHSEFIVHSGRQFGGLPK